MCGRNFTLRVKAQVKAHTVLLSRIKKPVVVLLLIWLNFTLFLNLSPNIRRVIENLIQTIIHVVNFKTLQFELQIDSAWLS